MLPYLIIGIASGSAYSLVGLGLVLTYKTSGIFNFAHGALATASAYIFYTLHVQHNVAWPIAAAVSVLGAGVVFGLAMERMAKGLERADLPSRIVATVGVLLLIQSVCQLHFGNVALTVQPFLPQGSVTLFGATITYDEIVVFLISVIATVALYVLFRWARLGKSMRAVVDNPDLLALAGMSPVRVRRAAWMIGCTFATLSGPLLVEILGRVDAGTLTALVVQAFAAAAIGSFASLPLTYLGGLLIGVTASLLTDFTANSQSPIISALPGASPFLILFLLMLLMPKSRLVLRSMVPRRHKERWSAPPRVQAAGLAATVVFLATVPAWAGFHLGDWTAMLTYVILFLSLGLLVKTSGQVSLCQVTFAAIGVAAFGDLTGHAGIPWIPALLLTGLVAVPVGAVVAIPAVRLSGVFLALATLGFGLLVQNMFYPTSWMFGSNGSGATLPLPHLSWLSVDSGSGFYYVVLIITVISSAVVIGLVRGRLGRLLRGIGDSPLALSTSGTSVTVTRVLVFSVSAYLAAVAGALFGVYVTVPSASVFDPFISTAYLALIVITVGIEPWYALVAALGFQLLGSYWQPAGFAYYLQICFGVFAILVAIFPPAGLPAALRSAIDRLGGPRRSGSVRWREFGPAAEGRAQGQGRPAGELVIADLTIRFGGLAAVTGVSLTASAGRITGLIGPNGAGKTTTLNACSGLVRPTSGKVILTGRDITRAAPAERARRGIGRTFQHVELWDSLTVAENIALGREARMAGANVLRQLTARPGEWSGVAKQTADALRLCDLESYADVPVGSLPTGTRRLVEVARCLAGGFDFILLDEPSSGLDRYETEAFGRILSRVIEDRGVGILLVDHDMRLVMDVCDYIYVLDFGKLIFDGPPDQVAASQLVRDAYLGSPELPTPTEVEP